MKRSAQPGEARRALPKQFFLTGTDTGVGKTYVARTIIAARRRAGIDCTGFKPFCCGARDDARILFRANEGTVPLSEVNPWWFRFPAAPVIASLVAKRTIRTNSIRAWARRIVAKYPSVVIEGIGGWRVPIRKDYAVSDLAADLNLPVVIVAANRLGVLNHLRLTVESISASGAVCAAVILNAPDRLPRGTSRRVTATNRAVLESLGDMPILFEIGHGHEAAGTLL